MWESLGLKDFDGARIRQTRDQVTYDVDLDDHLAAVEDEEILRGAILVQSFALTQATVEDKLGSGAHMTNGIENWGRDFLAANGKTWKDVRRGEGGVVEAAVVRNAIAHGSRTFSAAAAKRLRDSGAKTNARAGAKVSLSYNNLRGHRNSLESLLRAGGM